MLLNLPNSENIYFEKTKEYFNEVLSSYSNGNYRSAIVMLYSVVIADLLFKLQELNDVYNDKVANKILKEIEKTRKEDASRSQWEKDLIEKLYKGTDLLGDDIYADLNHLRNYRNLSAHPSLNDIYELTMPSKETTIALIKSMLENIFVKPPIFIKNIVDTLTDELSVKKDIYYDDRELENFVVKKYYSRMSDAMKVQTLSALWKFCFCLPDDEKCCENMDINRRSLIILTDYSVELVKDTIRQQSNKYSVANDKECVDSLILYLSNCPIVYQVLDKETKLIIETEIANDASMKALSWFKYENIQEHLNTLDKKNGFTLYTNIVDNLFQHYSEVGEQDLIINYFIDYYGTSHSFDSADICFDYIISPYLSFMTQEHFVKLIEYSNSNDQIYNRNRAKRANDEILECALPKLPKDFDLSEYKYFIYNKERFETFNNDEDVLG